LEKTLLDLTVSASSAPSGPAAERAPGEARGELFAGRYQVLSTLGEGGMGKVFRVRDLELDEEVALKVLHAEYAETEGALDRFRREVKLARRVTHPNVARVYDFGSSGKQRFLTMELVVGDSLTKRVRGVQPVLLPDALRIVGEIARGLAAAHAAGVVHRDLKPDNVLLDKRALAERGAERVVLTDFGIAVLAQDAGPTAERMIIGTPEYMAPEQVEGQEPDGRADVYSLGVVFFQLLTRQLPFDNVSPYVIAAAKLVNDAPKLRSLVSDLPESVATLADQMLTRFRERRPDMLRVVDTIDALRGAGKRAPAVQSLTVDDVSVTAPVVLVLPFEATDAESSAAAKLLGDAIADAIAASPSVRVFPPSAVDARAAEGSARRVAEQHGATHVVVGSVSRDQAMTRARLRVVEVSSGLQIWSEKLEAPVGTQLTLEDALSRVVVALFLDLGDAGGGPLSTRSPAERMPAEVRALYERGIAAVSDYGDHIERGIEALRAANRTSPNNPYVMSALGAALVRLWSFSGNSGLLVEAEDWSLRALATGTRIGETFATIGVLRLHQGEVRAAVDAFREAGSRSPRLAVPHSYLGRLMSEAGALQDGQRRLQRAVELDPGDHQARTELARIAAMQHEWDRADEILSEAARAAPHASGILLASKVRFTVWRDDPAALAACVAEVEARRDDPSLRLVVPMLLPVWRAIADKEKLAVDDSRLAKLREATGGMSLRLTMFWYQLLAEIGGVVGHEESALEAVEAAAMRTLIDVHWLDRCPALESLRSNARLSRARATVAARAASLWQ
jgi:serine/threonine-protein kinase